MASATRVPTIGKMIDDMKKIAQQRAALSAQDKELKAQQDELEAMIMEAMDKQDTRVGDRLVTKASSEAFRNNYDAIFKKPPFTCVFCGASSWVDPSDQTPPPDYCHESDHGAPSFYQGV